MKWSVYMVLCADGSYYVGITTNIYRRVEQHNDGTGAKYTRSRRPVRLVYVLGGCDRSEASKREYAMKQLTHAAKAKLAL